MEKGWGRGEEGNGMVKYDDGQRGVGAMVKWAEQTCFGWIASRTHSKKLCTLSDQKNKTKYVNITMLQIKAANNPVIFFKKRKRKRERAYLKTKTSKDKDWTWSAQV